MKGSQTAVHRHAVIVTSAGSSSRFNAGSLDSVPTKKELLEVEGLPMLARAVKPFLEVPGLVAVVVTYRDGLLEETRDSLKCLGLYGKVPVFFVLGGETRQDSVFNALSFLKGLCDEGLSFELVSIHDGARPFVSSDIVEACLVAAARFGGSAPCVPVSDTLVKVGDGFFSKRLDRTGVCCVQTPQVFRFPQIYEAHGKARALASSVGGEAGPSPITFTDDTQIFMEFGGHVAAVEGSPKNRKITYRSDLEVNS